MDHGYHDIDPLCSWNNGCLAFESNDGKLAVSTTTKADCELNIQGLTALIDGIHDSQDIPLHHWGNPDARLQAILRNVFPRMSPYMHEHF
jgi:hypothetical protein